MTDATEAHGLAWRLYHGETAFDFVKNRNRWFALSGTIILVGLIALATRGLNFGIDFKGGSEWQVSANGATVGQARAAVAKYAPNANVQTLTPQGSSGAGAVQLRVEAKINPADANAVTAALAKLTKTNPNDVTFTSIGASWGHDISQKAERALVAFFIAVFVFIALRFQWKMAFAAIVAVIHDILVTVGVYAVFNFDVTPATVIAILTILGYSLYDTVVVFDKVDENTKGLAASGRLTYSDTVNLSMNQVLMRSLNTSLVAVLPIASVLVVGDLFLGATTLKEFGLALFVGLITGAYSSIFIAAPILAILKEREPRYATIRARLESRGAGANLLTPKAAAEQSAAGRGGRAGAVAVDELMDDGELDAGEVDDLEPAGNVLRPAGASAGGNTGSAKRPAPQQANRPKPGAPRPAPRGRKKGGKRR